MVTTETNQDDIKHSQSPVDAAADAIDEQLAIVNGQALTQLPLDLYIPPDALEIFLAETFSGPLDLLLYLIK